MAEIDVAKLFKETRLKLKLNWVAGLDGGDNQLNSKQVTKPSLALIGHLNFVHPNRVQVLGCAEMDYLRSLSIIAMQQAITNLYSTDLAAVVVANGEKPPKELISAANSYNLIAECYLELKDYNLARKYIDSCKPLIAEIEELSPTLNLTK